MSGAVAYMVAELRAGTWAIGGDWSPVFATRPEADAEAERWRAARPHDDPAHVAVFAVTPAGAAEAGDTPHTGDTPGWVSVDPAVGADRDTARTWRVFTYANTTGTDSAPLERFDVDTVEAGAAALPAVDAALATLGVRRASVWGHGSGRGYVARIEFDFDRLLEGGAL